MSQLLNPRAKSWYQCLVRKQNICLIKKTSCHKCFRPTSNQLRPETTTKLPVTLCTKTFSFLGSGWNIQRWWRVSHQRCAEVFGFFLIKINSYMKNPAFLEILGYISKSHPLLADTAGFWTKNWSDYGKCLSLVNQRCFFFTYKHLKTEQVLPWYFNHKAWDDFIDLKGQGEHIIQRKTSLFTPKIEVCFSYSLDFCILKYKSITHIKYK